MRERRIVMGLRLVSGLDEGEKGQREWMMLTCDIADVRPMPMGNPERPRGFI